ncbi:hypothetical protein E2C01_099121 [Portunus trituberculatus]|uniref:Uncharacterized protein n=1 Tax=Portunus trituberculatus TaxID=210409 RepID=A0A5B7K307_PORTR|nr:hypothetical protein [Portunus trituberculatus]
MDQPYHFVYNLCRLVNTPDFRVTKRSAEWSENVDPWPVTYTYVLEREAGATKFTTYINDLNPSMTVYQVFRTDQYIRDYKCESFTRLKLVSHCLKI